MDYEARLQEYLDREVHPETAQNIGRIVATSPLMSAEGAMGIILQMQLDPARRDEELLGQEAANAAVPEYGMPIIERTEVAQEHFTNRFSEAQ